MFFVCLWDDPLPWVTMFFVCLWDDNYSKGSFILLTHIKWCVASMHRWSHQLLEDTCSWCIQLGGCRPRLWVHSHRSQDSGMVGIYLCTLSLEETPVTSILVDHVKGLHNLHTACTYSCLLTILCVHDYVGITQRWFSTSWSSAAIHSGICI